MSRKFSTEQITRIVALIILILTAIFTFIIHEYIILITVILCIMGLVISPKLSDKAYKKTIPIQIIISVALLVIVILFSAGLSRLGVTVCIISSSVLIMQMNRKI